MIDHDGTHRLAAMANALRPDWPVKSLVTFIGANLQQRTYREAAIALAWVACDPVTETPKRLLEAGPWWSATRAQAATVSVIPTRCGEHPTRRALDCPECAETASADPTEGAAAVRAALREAPRYTDPAVIAARQAEHRRLAAERAALRGEGA